MNRQKKTSANSSCQDDFQKQLAHMIGFIDQEVEERVEELDAKGEEEYNIEKARILNVERNKIKENFAKKEQKVYVKRKILDSKYNNLLRLRILENREKLVDEVIEDTRKFLGSIAEDKEKYTIVLQRLILQGALQLLERNVTIRARKEDVDLAKSVIESVAIEYEAITGKKCNITVNETNFLNANSYGGVILYAQRGRLRIDNTLNSRLTLITKQVTPSIRSALFGDNPNRKFID